MRLSADYEKGGSRVGHLRIFSGPRGEKDDGELSKVKHFRGIGEA